MDEKLRAEQAKGLLDNETLKLALDELRQETIAKWSECPARDTEGREWLWMFYQNTIRFESVLKGYMASGKIDDFNKKQQHWYDKVTHMVKRKPNA